MGSDFHNIKDSGKACIGCGNTSNKVVLTRLKTYARSYACSTCFKKYWNCGAPGCNHFPHPNGRICSQCGCKDYIHGLAAEFDRQYAAGVGVSPRLKECNGFGINLGKCGRIILASADGTFERLCSECTHRWMREAIDGQREFAKNVRYAAILENLDTETETAN